MQKEQSKQQERGSFVNTYTGKRWYILDPRPEEIDLVDIAHSLATKVRFGGAMEYPWVVLQHSIMCYKMACLETNDLRARRTALLHDAPEGPLGDMVRPLRRECPDYEGHYDRTEHVMFDYFNLKMTDQIQYIDDRNMITEAYLLHNPDIPDSAKWWETRYSFGPYHLDPNPVVANTYMDNFKLLLTYNINQLKREFFKCYENVASSLDGYHDIKGYKKQVSF